MRGYIFFEGKWVKWRDLVELRRQQKQDAKTSQLTLFEMRDDARPLTDRSADGRYSEPLLPFKE
jgi:hypothetical protein